MTDPSDSVRRSVEESLAPRLADQSRYLACASPDPLPLSRADLLYLWDDFHVEMLDFASVCQPLGHRNQNVYGAVADHMRYYGLTAPQGQHLLRWPVEYARSLSECLSGPSGGHKVLFCEGQRDALQRAVLLARHHSDRSEVMAVDTGWHDWLPGCRILPNRSWDEMSWEGCGALVICAVDAVYHPVPGVRQWILAARERGVPVVFDESVTGFGRTGTLWGQEHSGLMADLTVLGGAAGGGLPLGAVVASPDFFDTPEMFSDIPPQAGHPWSCAAGQVTLDMIREGVLEHVKDSSSTLSSALDGLVGQFPDHLSHHQGLGLLRGLCFTDRLRASSLPVEARAHGLHVAPAVGNTVLLAPPLVASIHEVTRGVDLICDVLMSWEDGGTRST